MDGVYQHGAPTNFKNFMVLPYTIKHLLHQDDNDKMATGVTFI